MLTQAITGTFATGNQRYADRRVLRLKAQLSAEDAREGALIHNLSSTGMLLSAQSGLSVGETIAIELPDGESRNAEIVWADEGLFGCRFDKPLTQAALSAAFLRANPEPAADAMKPEPAAQLERLKQHWAMEGETAAPAKLSVVRTAALEEEKLPLGQRGWVIIGLSLSTWIVAATITYLVWQLLA